MSKENTSQAAANKAEEEGEMTFFLSDIYEICDEYAKFFASKERDDMSSAVYQVKSRFQHLASKKDAIAADRAARQVSNKAEVDLSSLERYDEGESRLFPTPDGEYVLLSDVKALLATPPATTGASTVLTDEQLICKVARENGAPIPIAVARAIAREVAAQAGQVAVPGWISVDDGLPDFAIQVLGYSTARNLVSTCYRYKSDHRGWASAVLYSEEITHWMPLPPSPAKESK